MADVTSWAVLGAAFITGLASVTVGYITRSTRKEIRAVRDKVQTRNGDSIGDIITDVHNRIRKVETAVKTIETIQDDTLEGYAFLAMAIGRVERSLGIKERGR